MNYKQYLYSKLAEEAGELAQAAIKAQLFGELSTDPRESTGETNLTKLVKEYLDLMLIMQELDKLITDDFNLDANFDPVAYGKQKSLALTQNWNIVQERMK